MKKIISIMILALVGYFLYQIFSPAYSIKDKSLQKNESPGDQVLVSGYESIQETINSAQTAVNEIEDRNSLIESENVTEGITPLNDSGVDMVIKDSAEPGRYVEYEQIDIASLEGDIVLDFYASWCPSCRKLEKNILATAKDIPSDLTIIKVDYDTATDLKKEYGVTRQHTLVQIDKQGNLIAKWSGGSTLASIVEKIQ